MSHDELDRFPTQSFDLETILEEFGESPPDTPVQEPTINLEDTIHWTQKVARLTGLANWDDSADPAQTVVHSPKADPREVLHTQLMEGPERRYYELAEQGTSRLQVALFVNLLMLVLSGGMVFLSTASMVDSARLRILIIGQLLPLVVSTVLGCKRLIAGIRTMIHGRITPDSLLIISLSACVLDWFFSLRQLEMPYCAVFSLQISMALWAEYDRRKTELRQMDTLRKANQLTGILRAEGYYERKAGFLRGKGQLDSFMEHYQEVSGPDQSLSWYLLAVLLCCTAAAIAVGIRVNAVFGIRTWVVSLLLAFPATGFFATSHPKAILYQRLHKVGAVICGWKAALTLCKDGAIPLSDQHLFPDGSVKLNGVKFYSDRDPDQLVAYATALIGQEGGLAPLFRQLQESRGCPTYTVKNQRTYTNGGLGGEVNGEPILVGTLRFMQRMGVELPEGTQVNQAVYLAINGVMCAVFAIHYDRDKHVISGLNALCSYTNLRPVLLTGDFMLTAGFLRHKFGGHARRMLCPTPAVREALTSKEPDAEAQTCALLTVDSLEALAYVIAGARAVRGAMKAGVIFQILSGILGLAAVFLLVISGSLTAANASNVLLFQLIQAIPALLFTQWARFF